MKKDDLDFTYLRRSAYVLCGLLLMVFSGLYFFNASAQTEDVKQPDAQNLVNGKIAFIGRFSGATAPEGRVFITNPDGTGAVGLSAGNEDMMEPAWSPDGTRIVFSSRQPNQDIYSINTNGTGLLRLTNTGSSLQETNPAWSATGKIAYQTSSFNGNDYQIWIVNADGTGNARFSAITQPFPNSPAWSPDGSKLAFTSNDRIWIINADGTNEHRLTNNASAEGDANWSSDGSRIVFSISGSGITVINADGTNQTSLMTSGGSPAWSPDGTKIAFVRGGTGNGVFTMDANGTNQVRIATNTTQFPLCCDYIYENPAWQPVAQTPNTYNIGGGIKYNNLPVSGVTMTLSGTTNAATTTDAAGNYQFSGLAPGGNYTVTPSLTGYLFKPASRTFNNLTSNQFGSFEVLGVCIGTKCVRNGKIAYVRSGDIFTISEDGSGETNITNNAASDDEPNFSPLGSSIVFTTNRDGSSEIYRMNADGSNPVRLTNNSANDFSPFYAPDGASIVFMSTRDGVPEIYKMNADGSNQVRLTNNALTEIQPSFAPDGSKIIFAVSAPTPRKIYTMNADGSNPQPIPMDSGNFNIYERPTYSPDGSKIIYTYSPSQSTGKTNWIMNSDGSNRSQLTSGISAVYSPDGKQVVYTCCVFNNTNRVRVSPVNVASERVLTPNSVGNSLPAWQSIPVIPRTPFDYDGDGRADVSVFRPAENKWFVLQSADTSVREKIFAASDDIPAPADYDGDGKTDLAIFRPGLGTWWYLSSITNAQLAVTWGRAGDIPRPSDIDGDGKTDFVYFRPSNNTWYRLTSGTAIQSQIVFGSEGDKPLVGDFDGDGKADPAVFRPSTGDWWYRSSITGQFITVHWGANGDYAVPGDYDGDGKTDFVVFRPSDGGWYILYSTGSYTIATFGTVGDKPVAADYDGDGKTDIAVFRPSTGIWYLLQTTSGFGAVGWGNSSDIPTEHAFNP